jgi:hypothetical protein
VKLGYVISAVVVLAVLAALTWVYGMADAPTAVTNAQALRAQTLPADLPELFTPGDPQADATPIYEQAIALYTEQRGALPRTREHDELVSALADLLIAAADAGRVQPGFMDRHIPIRIGAEPDFADSVEAIYELAVYESAYRYSHGDTQGARDLARAVWVLGRRMFQENVRLYNRVVGMDMMESAGSMLYEMSSDDPDLSAEALGAWAQAIKGIRRTWQPKLIVVMGLDPPIGDLLNIALRDQDRMFRVEATLRLGIFKHTGSRGNRRACLGAIQEAVDSGDPMLAQAGQAADALTLKEKRRLY